MKMRTAIAMAIGLAAAACSSDPAMSDATTTGAGGATAAATGAGGSTTSAGSGGGIPTTFGGDRPVDLWVPESYDASKAAPLLLLLHGYTASGTIQDAYFATKAAAMSKGMLYAHPDGTVDPTGEQFWNATNACCDFAGSGVDDSAYLKGVIDDIQAAYNVDPKRIYLMGHSNGSFMAYRMACDHPTTIAAIAGLAGGTYVDPANCQANQSGDPVHVLHIHGTEDETVAYEGATAGVFQHPGAVATVEFWRDLAGCNTTGEAGDPIDLESSLAGTETDVLRYADGCDGKGSAELWTINGGSHIPTFQAGFSDRVLDYLLAHPK